MSRPIKDGVDYFPKDTGFYHDDKVKLLRARFGAKGMYLLDYLLCEIYGKRGYYIRLDQNTCYLVSDGAGCGCHPNFVQEFIQACLSVGFFDKSRANVCHVLTSAGIQRRYIRMFNSRDAIYLMEEYLLLDKSSKKDFPRGILEKCVFQNVFCTDKADKSTGNPDKSTGNAQSKAKEKETTLSLCACAQGEKAEKEPERYTGKNGNLLLLKAEQEELLRKGIPQAYLDYFSDKLKKCGYRYDDHFAVILDWWHTDRLKSPWNHSQRGAGGKEEEFSSFDTDDFFHAALEKSLRETESTNS